MSNIIQKTITKADGSEEEYTIVELSGRGLGPYVPLTDDSVAVTAPEYDLGATYDGYDFGGDAIGHFRYKVNTYTEARTLNAVDKGALVLVDSADPVVVTLPADWNPGDFAIIRQVGAGAVSWAADTGATVALPTTRAAHTQIAEQHAEITVRVVSNADGESAVWSITGETGAGE